MKSRKYKTRGCIYIYWNNAPHNIFQDVWNIIKDAVLRWEEAYPKGTVRIKKNDFSMSGSHSDESGYVSSRYIPLEEHDVIVAQLRDFMERVV